MAEMTPTQARELELTRRGLGSFDDFSKYLESQRTVPVDTGLTAMDGSPLEGRGLDFSAEGISRGLAPARRAIGRGVLNPLASLQDLIAVPASTAEALISKGLGGVSSALGATDVGQFFLDQGDKGFDRASSKLSEALGPGQVVNPLDGTLSPADNEQLLDIFGPDPSIGRPKGMVPGKTTIKPGTEGLPKKQIPDPSSNVDAAARLMMEQSQTKADANREASLATSSGSASKTEDPMGDYSGKEPTVDLFMEAMAEGNKAKGEKPTKAASREDLLEKYKQEFADATGIDISGKPDNSQALMAMGLSMMQNRAGKGFNVGKMLSAVGEAGEKAMPELSRARQEAKAAKVAAGKYALGQIEKGESAAAAIAAEDKAFQRERFLKLLQMDADFEKERIKAGGKVSEIKNVKADKVINGLTVQRGRGATGAVFVFPQDALRDTSGALKSVNGALGTVDTMTDLATQIANEESPTFSLIRDRVNTALVGAGLADAEVVFGDAKVGKAQQMKIFQQSIITQFKRMLTQETGNGISAKDVEQINLMLGEIDLFGNPQGSLKRLAEIKTLFMGKRRAIRGVLDELQDPELYPTEGEYTKNMELYPTLIQGNTAYRPVDGQGSPIDIADPK